MFHFPRFARSLLCIQSDVRRHYPPWVSPFGHPRIKAWLAAPRGFSQLPTSFFASCRLGIHRVPFVAWSSLFFVHSSGLQSSKTRVQRGVVNRRTFPTTNYTCLLAHMQFSKIVSNKAFGGADRDRTDDIQLAKLALSQLSYGPFPRGVAWWAWVDLNYRPHAYQACALTS